MSSFVDRIDHLYTRKYGKKGERILFYGIDNLTNCQIRQTKW